MYNRNSMNLPKSRRQIILKEFRKIKKKTDYFITAYNVYYVFI